MKTEFSEKERSYQENLLQKGFFGSDARMGYWHCDDGSLAFDLKYILDSQHSDRNLYEPIRQEVLRYFERYDIAWWRQYEDHYFPTGHLLSSQNHCLNHLFAIRKNPEAVLELIKPIGAAAGICFDKVLPSFIDTREAYYDKAIGKAVANCNYISFEFVCHNIDLLEETYEKRGAKCTSVDALIYAQAGKERWLIPIEWKYTESYDHKGQVFTFDRYSKYVTESSRLSEWSPFFSQDPFFELGRQTLLMEQLVECKPLVGKVTSKYPQQPLIADNFLHVIVVPQKNIEMGIDAERFRTSLKENYRKYVQIVNPEELLKSIKAMYANLCEYLQERYWNS